MRRLTPAAVIIIGLAACAGTAGSDAGPVTVYSGREQELIAATLERFTDATGIEVEVRYGDSAALAAQLLEEGDGTAADVFWAQDAGALGAVAAEGLLRDLPSEVLDRVPAAYASTTGEWVGISGRVRTVVYNTERVDPGDLPASIMGFAAPRWEGRIGWAPTNASFQASVTALRALEGERATRAWLQAMKRSAVDYPKNTPIVQAAAAGEIDVGLVNHYYLLRLLDEEPDAPVANHFFEAGDPGGLVNVAGAGVTTASDDSEAALELIRFLLTDEAQRDFAAETFEYPLVPGIAADDRLPPFEELEPPAIDLSALSDLEATLELLADVGIL